MKKIYLLLILTMILSGCATYKFDLGKEAPYDGGYVVTRDYRIIPEYTVGKDDSAPEALALAKVRFKRRRKTVEYYYKQMDIIENTFARLFWTPFAMIGKTVVGVFRLPAIAYCDYKYNHNAEYREKIRQQDTEEEALEETRLNKLKAELSAYIQADISEENR